jgi:glycosyltransferase involved in cell wall biosynthesis
MRAEFLPMGVDAERFLPVDGSVKRMLRKKYGLPEDDRVVLHVGHLQPLRNLGWVVSVHETVGSTTIVVGGTAMGVDPEVRRLVADAGLHVMSDYLDHIEEIYQLADCYVFPVTDEGAAIGVPLSVLEAMACNLPVVTTPFGGFPQMCSEGEGLFFAGNPEEFVRAVQHALALPPEAVRTRDKVLAYSWPNIRRIVLNEARQVAAL